MTDKIKSNKKIIFETEILIGSEVNDNDNIDGLEELIGVPRSSRELAKRLVDHLISREYQKVAKILIEEARILLSKIGSDNTLFLDEELQQFEIGLSDLIERFYLRDYEKPVSKLEELRILNKTLELESIKNFLDNIFGVIKDYAMEKKGLHGKEDDCKKLQSAFESSFDTIKAL